MQHSVNVCLDLNTSYKNVYAFSQWSLYPSSFNYFYHRFPKLLLHAQAKGPLPLSSKHLLSLDHPCLDFLACIRSFTIIMTSTDAPHQVWSLPASTLLCLWVGTPWPLANTSNVSNLSTFLSSMEECRRPTVLSSAKEWHKKTGATTLSALLLIMTPNLS